MYSRILVISDNLILSSRFNEIIDDPQYSNLNWNFSVSTFSDLAKFEANLNRKVLQYNLKSEQVIDKLIDEYDLIFSVHCKQIFPTRLIQAIKCINVHPGYNPINRGWYPQVFAIIYNLQIGATIHEIDEKLDHGKIIDRAFVEKEIYDTSESLYNKIVEREIELVRKNLPDIITNRYKVFDPENEGNLFLKKDFNELLEIDLSKSMTGLDFINRIRALSFGGYKNAYFVDPKDGNKVYFKINFEVNDPGR